MPMSQRSHYPLPDALNDLEAFFRKHVKDSESLNQLLQYLAECRSQGRIGFRYLHEELISYRQRFSDYFPYSGDEKKMIDDLFYFWG
jgi:hypothetical protein